MANNASLAMQAPAISDPHPSVRTELRRYPATIHKNQTACAITPRSTAHVFSISASLNVG